MEQTAVKTHRTKDDLCQTSNHSCLSICLSGSEGFALGECVTVPHAQAVLYCLASNFLEVKQLACTLLQKLPTAAVGLQVGWI